MERAIKHTNNSPGDPASPGAAERVFDWLTGALIYGMVIFSPWAFGTTQPWSIWSMNVGGYALGFFWLGKRLCQWGRRKAPRGLDANGHWITRVLFTLTLLILFYCLVAAVNARATYSYADNQFVYHEFISWLPHSYDRARSFALFWNYLALAGVFWAARAWLQNDSAPARLFPGAKENPLFSRRWKKLLWLISLNGGLLALEGILQRADNTGKLLWLVEPRIHKTAESQFGPYAYRSNGAQWLNLIWPMTVGLWWELKNSVARRRLKFTTHHLLLPLAMLMVAGAIISLSRAGIIVALGEIFAALLVLLLANHRRGWKIKFVVLIFCLLTAGLAAYVNWPALSKRFETITTDQLGGRERVFQIAEKMARDYPVFGTGPNTFDPVSQLYRASSEEDWIVQVHNDWLETLATFGWVGSSLIWLALLLVFFAPVFCRRGYRADNVVIIFLWSALGGCLVFATVDFPFQIYSILFLFLILCATLSSFALRK